jgi:hypothetical protein
MSMWFKIKLETVMKRPAMERGSEYLLRDLAKMSPVTPFFLYLNLMEAHEPYFWGENSGAIRAASDPRSAYGRHARLAIDRALDAVALLEKHNPLIIVTSDHGQLLGEEGRYGHGTHLHNALLQVPFYVRYPTGVDPFLQEKPLISLLEIYKLITSIVSSTRTGLGSDYAFAESFGLMDEVSWQHRRAQSERLSKLYAVRVKIYSRGGSVLYNKTDDVVEKTEGGLSSDEVSRLVGLARTAEPTVAPVVPQPSSSADEEAVLDRLRQLGYA